MLYIPEQSTFLADYALFRFVSYEAAYRPSNTALCASIQTLRQVIALLMNYPTLQCTQQRDYVLYPVYVLERRARSIQHHGVCIKPEHYTVNLRVQVAKPRLQHCGEHQTRT